MNKQTISHSLQYPKSEKIGCQSWTYMRVIVIFGRFLTNPGTVPESLSVVGGGWMKWMEDEAWHRSIITKAVHPWIHIRVSTLLDIRFLDICFDNFFDNFLTIFKIKQCINQLLQLFVDWGRHTCRNYPQNLHLLLRLIWQDNCYLLSPKFHLITQFCQQYISWNLPIIPHKYYVISFCLKCF